MNKIRKYIFIAFIAIVFFSLLSFKHFSITSNNHIIDEVNRTTFTIDKMTSDEHLSAVIDQLKQEEVTASFSGVKRNDENEITSIRIVLKNNISTASFSTSNTMGIATLQIEIDNGQISIGYLGEKKKLASAFSLNDLFAGFDEQTMNNLMSTQQHFMQQMIEQDSDQMQQLMQIKKKLMQQFKDDDNEVMQQLLQQFKQVHQNDSFQKQMQEIQNLFSGSDGLFSIQKLTNSNTINLTDFEDDDYKVTYIVNGKKITKEEFLKMDKKDIKTIAIEKIRVK